MILNLISIQVVMLQDLEEKDISRNIFKNYVNALYDLRLKYPKGHPLNYIAKLLLNSLYGRMGMNDSFPTIEIIDKAKFFKLEDNLVNNNSKFVELGDKIMVIYRNHQDDVNTLLDGHKETHNVSISIASAITAYARIHMSQFKNNPDFKLFYSDTDSAYTDKPLPEDLVNSKVLGKMKLEHICDKAIFLAPKMYCLQTVEGKVIYKVKGLSHDVNLTMDNFEQLLYKDTFIKKLQIK
jgi:DNA polymerase elongation subunit (family B)